MASFKINVYENLSRRGELDLRNNDLEWVLGKEGRLFAFSFFFSNPTKCVLTPMHLMFNGMRNSSMAINAPTTTITELTNRSGACTISKFVELVFA